MSDLPLSDVRVLDLTRLLPGPYCSLLLADFGADVVKIEDTGAGDYIRWAPPYYGGEEMQASGTRSALYLSLNRNKRSVRLNLKSDEGREALLRLAASYDVVLESFRPGVMDRLGVGYEAMREVNPGIILCAITGYGQDGPNRDRAGHDMNYLGLNGILGLTGAEGGPPVQAGAQIADLGGGAMMAAFAVMAALHERSRSGLGQMVDISMTDGALSWLAMPASRYFCEGKSHSRGEQELAGRLICYFPYEASDGWVSCGALEPKFWAGFCKGVGRPELIESQFERPGSDAWRQVAEVFRTRDRAGWTEFNDEHDCCIEAILDLDEVLESDLVAAREMVIELDQPGIGTVRQLGIPAKLGRTPGTVHSPAPALGEHTGEVLTEAGYSEEEITAMIEQGAAAGPGGGMSGEFRV